MLPIWDADIETGYAPIDADHREVVAVMETFLRAVESGARGSLPETFDQVITRMQRHFAFEEAMMAEHRDPNGNDHREAHASFIEHLERTRRDKLSRGLSEDLRQWAFGRFVTWFRFHIKAYDFGLARLVAKDRPPPLKSQPPS